MVINSDDLPQNEGLFCRISVFAAVHRWFLKALSRTRLRLITKQRDSKIIILKEQVVGTGDV